MSETPRPDCSESPSKKGPAETRLQAATAKAGTRLTIQGGLLALALIYSLYVARDFLLPIVVAVLLSFLLRPIVRGLKGAHLPESVGAAVVLVVILSVTVVGVQQLAEPAAEWLARAPRTFRDLGYRMKEMKKPVEQATRAAAEAEKIADVVSDQGAPKVTIQEPTLSDAMLSETWEFLLSAVITLILLYFLLASGDLLLAKLVKVFPALSEKKDVVEVVRGVEQGVSLYLITQATINIALGVAVGLSLWWFGVPNPVLWGVLACLLNFVPYLGAMVTALILTLVAAATFQEITRVISVVAAFVTLTAIEGLIITPMILGKRLALNSIAVFLSLVFWGWIWGVAGALLAVPLLATVKIVCDQVESLSAISEFLSS